MQDKGCLTFASHGKRVAKLRPKNQHPRIQMWLDQAKLTWLDRTPITQLNQQLLSAFIERWHAETSSFHMPWGEMTITLDDISTLLRIPVVGKCFAPLPVLDYYGCLDYGEQYFGISRAESADEFGTRTPAYKLRSLGEYYKRNLSQGRLDEAARCYILHLLGSTIIADTSKISIGAKWMKIVADFESIGTWNWGITCLSHLYNALNQAVYYDTKTMMGYTSLLQCWIYEHFPSIVDREHVEVPSDYPRACRWSFTQLHHLDIDHFRRQIDDVDIEEVVFTPYDDDREHHPLHKIALWRGWFPYADAAVRYMPDRVLWQFGMIQQIPTPPFIDQPLMADINRNMKHWQRSFVPMQRLHIPIPEDLAFQMADGYYDWFVSVSFPRLTDPQAHPQAAQAQAAQAQAGQAQHDDDPAQHQTDDVAPRRRSSRAERRLALRARLQGALDVIYTDPAEAHGHITAALADLELGSD